MTKSNKLGALLTLIAISVVVAALIASETGSVKLGIAGFIAMFFTNLQLLLVRFSIEIKEQ